MDQQHTTKLDLKILVEYYRHRLCAFLMFIYFHTKLFFLQFVCCLCKILTVIFWVMTLCNHRWLLAA